MLVLLVALLLLYPILRDLLAWAYRPLNNLPPNRTPVANRRDVKPAGHGSSQAHPRNDVQPGRVSDHSKAEASSAPGPAAVSLTSGGQSRRQRRAHAPAPSASQPGLAPGNIVLPTKASAATLPSAASISTLGPSFVKKFEDLKVNPAHSHLASSARASRGAVHPGPTTRSVTRGRTRSLSPLTTPPSSPPPSPSPSPSPSLCYTPAGSRGRARAGPGVIDFSLYKKKTRALTKSPKKLQTKAAGKLLAEAAADVTTTAWFYKITAEAKLLVTPPDLTGHPDGLVPGDVYFDRVRDTFQLWLWCLDGADELHWTKIPFGYQRDDGKHLIVTPKNHLLSWVTPSYYKQIGSAERPSVSEEE